MPFSRRISGIARASAAIACAISILIALLPSVCGSMLYALGASKTFITPQEAFLAARLAMQRDDLARLCECLTDESRDLFAGGLTLRVMTVKKTLSTSKNRDDQLLLKKVDQILAKHNLTAKQLDGIGQLDKKFQANDLAGRIQLARILLEPVRERNVFLSELVSALQQPNHKNGAGVPPTVGSGSELTDLVIDATTARGQVVHKQNNKQVRHPILFKRIDGSWKIDMTAELNKAFSTPQKKR